MVVEVEGSFRKNQVEISEKEENYGLFNEFQFPDHAWKIKKECEN